MNIREKLNFFHQLIQCNHNLSLHSYEPELILTHSGTMQNIISNDDDALVLLSLREPIRKHIEKEIREPLFIDDHLGLIWIVVF